MSTCIEPVGFRITRIFTDSVCPKTYFLGIVTTGQDWNPHMMFIMKGSQTLALQLKGWFKSKTSIQEYISEIRNSYWTSAWIIWYVFTIQCEELILNHLTLLLVVTMPYSCWFLWRVDYIENFKWCLHFAMWHRILKGCFERGRFWRPKSCLKGIEDFNVVGLSRP